MNTESIIRKLAKQIGQQNIFLASKEINGIKIFDNNTEFSGLQQIYLSYLYFYNNLYMDISMKRVTERVMNNSIREDSYSYYKKEKEPNKDLKKKEKDIHLVFKKQKVKNKKNNTKEVD